MCYIHFSHPNSIAINFHRPPFGAAEMAPKPFNVDELIEELLACRNVNINSRLDMTFDNLVTLCKETTNTLLSQPMLLDIPAPIVICGDVHGQYFDLLRIFEYCGHPPSTSYLFLGDFVDRGKNSIETITLLLAYKLKHPTSFFLIRGNHESEWTNSKYGFRAECESRFCTELWKTFNDTFNCMPVAGKVGNKIFCCHGGLSPDLKNLDQIRNLERPACVPNEGIMCDLLWADPEPGIKGWQENESRNTSYCFGEDVVEEFLQKHDLDLVVRAHQSVGDGYEFFAGDKLVTIFSAPEYCGQGNMAAVMMVNSDLNITFHQFQQV